jgi:hypothetical protein
MEGGIGTTVERWSLRERKMEVTIPQQPLCCDSLHTSHPVDILCHAVNSKSESLEKRKRKKHEHFDHVQRTPLLGFRVAGTPCFHNVSQVPTRVFHLRVVTHGSLQNKNPDSCLDFDVDCEGSFLEIDKLAFEI